MNCGGYNATGLDAALNRPSEIQESGGSKLELYDYLGLSTITGRGRPGLPGQETETDPDGQIGSLQWTNGTSALVQDVYGYDKAGRLICQLDEPGKQQDQLWTYNGLGQLQKWQRGTLDISGANPLMSQTQTTDSAWWDLDSQGTRSGGHYTLVGAPGATLDGPYSEAASLDQGGNQQEVRTLGDVAQLQFTYDAWGRVVKATGDDGAVFAYRYRLDAFGRIIGRIKYRMDGSGQTTQVLERVSYYYAGDKVIEERTGRAVSTQYVWAPDGRLILRDRNADGKAATGNLGKVGSGLEQRTYALTDAFGSVVAITDASGQLLERYVYRENGSVRALKPDWSGWPQGIGSLDGKSSRYDWVYLWHGGRDAELVKNCSAANQTDGSYILAGGTWYDARHGTTMQPDPSLLAMGRNAYKPNMASDAVGFGEGMIPIWGNGKQAYYNFSRWWQTGSISELITGAANTYLAATDVLLVGMLGKAAGKAILTGLTKEAIAQSAKLGGAGALNYAGREIDLTAARMVQLDAEVARNTPWRILVKMSGDYGEDEAKQTARYLGETVIESQYPQGAAMKGFDFLSFTGRGTDARLLINEVKSVRGGVPLTEFTTFGFGREGPAAFSKAMGAAETAIVQAGLDDITTSVLLSQLKNNTARIRLVGDQFTRFSPGIMETIGEETGMIVGEGFRVLR